MRVLVRSISYNASVPNQPGVPNNSESFTVTFRPLAEEGRNDPYAAQEFSLTVADAEEFAVGQVYVLNFEQE